MRGFCDPAAGSIAADHPAAQQGQGDNAGASALKHGEEFAQNAELAYRPLKAPRENKGRVIEPPLSEVGHLLAEQAARPASDYDVQGRRLGELADAARRDFLAEAYHYTSSYRDVESPRPGTSVLLAGHQPQLFHPGVWLKNFALGWLAARHGATAVNLQIDGDTIKEASIRVPGGPADDPATRQVPYDDPATEIPFEERTIANRSTLESFAQRAGELIAPLVGRPLLDRYWPMVVERSRETSNLGECLAQARHQLEGSWGLSTLELPLSRVCSLDAFGWFAAHCLAELPRLRAVYNDSVALYRRVHHIRSANHPVPDLASEGDWLEAPFWLWTGQRPHRRRIFARRRGSELLISDRDQIEFSLPLSAGGNAERAAARLAELPAQGIRLRSRALTTTLFARLFLGDLFLHGIGGGKYDQLTDLVIRRFFGMQPPGWMVLSATLHLPVRRLNASMDDARRAARRLRELTYQPERHIGPPDPGGQASEISRLIETKRRWIDTAPTKENAHQRAGAIRAVNDALQPWVEPQRRHWLAEQERLARFQRAQSVLTWREYAFCLYPEETLRDFLLDFPDGRA